MPVPVCERCGRRLRNEESIKLGLGTVCYKKTFGATPKNRSKKNKVKNYDTNKATVSKEQIGIEELSEDTEMEKEHI